MMMKILKASSYQRYHRVGTLFSTDVEDYDDEDNESKQLYNAIKDLLTAKIEKVRARDPSAILCIDSYAGVHSK